jgi:putative nucleotidyltransferase with HDIG domain
LITNSPRLLLVHGHDAPRQDIRQVIRQRYVCKECGLRDLPSFGWREHPLDLLIDAPLENEADAQHILEAMRKLPKDGPGIAFVVERLSRPLVVRAHALGAEGVVPRPITEGALFTVIDRMLERSRKRSWREQFGQEASGLAAGTEALEQLFQFASVGTRLTQYELYDRGDGIIDTLGESGLGRWVEAVKLHHSQTFRHSLLVTGIAVGFGQLLQMRQDDLRRLAVGGLIHDIGKAMVPVTLLEKPGRLTDSETDILREHTLHGRDILSRQGGFAPEMIDVVVHHHEMLDGSGYPHQLSGSEIKDLVRIITISDIFAAMIERRAYKLPLPNEEAYAYLETLEGKLDASLVNAFRPIALETRLAA